MSSALSALTAERARWVVTAAIVLTIVFVAGVDLRNEMIPALEQCAPNCEFRG